MGLGVVADDEEAGVNAFVASGCRGSAASTTASGPSSKVSASSPVSPLRSMTKGVGMRVVALVVDVAGIRCRCSKVRVPVVGFSATLCRISPSPSKSISSPVPMRVQRRRARGACRGARAPTRSTDPQSPAATARSRQVSYTSAAWIFVEGGDAVEEPDVVSLAVVLDIGEVWVIGLRIEVDVGFRIAAPTARPLRRSGPRRLGPAPSHSRSCRSR